MVIGVRQEERWKSNGTSILTARLAAGSFSCLWKLRDLLIKEKCRAERRLLALMTHWGTPRLHVGTEMALLSCECADCWQLGWSGFSGLYSLYMCLISNFFFLQSSCVFKLAFVRAFDSLQKMAGGFKNSRIKSNNKTNLSSLLLVVARILISFKTLISQQLNYLVVESCCPPIMVQFSCQIASLKWKCSSGLGTPIKCFFSSLSAKWWSENWAHKPLKGPRGPLQRAERKAPTCTCWKLNLCMQRWYPALLSY